MSEINLLFCVLVVLTFASAFCSSSETAFFSLSSSRVRLWRDSPDNRQKLVAKLLSQSRRLLVLIFMLNTVVNILIQNVSSELCGLTAGSGWLLKIAVPLFLILIVGEFLPKYFGMMCSETLTLRIAPLFNILEKILGPIQRVITTVAETLSRVMFFYLKPTAPLNEDELEEVIVTSQSMGVLSSEEASLIRHSVDFENKEARELMIPRSSMAALKRSSCTKAACIAAMRHAPSRPILIVEETIDRPIGAIGTHEASLFRSSDIDSILSASTKNIFFVPEAMPAKKLLQEFCHRRAALACVTDEHGSISGYIEANDLAKRLLGFPLERSSGLSTKEPGTSKSIVVPGSTPIEDVNDFFHTNLESTYSSSTIGGWLTEQFDGIPPPGTSYVGEELNFRVLQSDDKIIKQLFIERRPQRNPTTKGEA